MHRQKLWWERFFESIRHRTDSNSQQKEIDVLKEQLSKANDRIAQFDKERAGFEQQFQDHKMRAETYVQKLKDLERERDELKKQTSGLAGTLESERQDCTLRVERLHLQLTAAQEEAKQAFRTCDTVIAQKQETEAQKQEAERNARRNRRLMIVLALIAGNILLAAALLMIQWQTSRTELRRQQWLNEIADVSDRPDLPLPGFDRSAQPFIPTDEEVRLFFVHEFNYLLPPAPAPMLAQRLELALPPNYSWRAIVLSRTKDSPNWVHYPPTERKSLPSFGPGGFGPGMGAKHGVNPTERKPLPGGGETFWFSRDDHGSIGLPEVREGDELRLFVITLSDRNQGRPVSIAPWVKLPRGNR
jgi:hypothetical protein